MKNAPIENLKVRIRPRNHPAARRKLQKEKIFGSWISTGRYRDFVDSIIDLTESRKSSYVCFANVHMVIEAEKDPEFSSVVNQADIVTPDGRPLSLFLKFFKGKNQERVCGMDVLPHLLSRAEDREKSVFFYGTTDEILHALVAKAKSEFPRLKICGSYAPPFRDLTDVEKKNIIDEINSAHPDLVLVALGCPKQEKWMAEHKGKILSCMLGLGQAFKVYTGMEKRLPKWMRNLSLEWLYRLYLEPKRLWRRYFYTNSYFIYLTLRHALKSIFGKPEPQA